MSEIAENNLGGFSFTSPRLSRDDNSLVLFFNHHLIISVFGDHENMRLLLACFHPALHVETFLSIFPGDFCVEKFWKLLIWVDSNQNRRTNVGVDQPVEESRSDNVQQGAFVKFTEIKKVAHLLKNCGMDNSGFALVDV